MIKSLRGRLLLVATVVLAFFLGLTGLVLDRAFRNSAASAEEVYLQGLVFGLLADAELTLNGGLEFPPLLSESRFALPGSGLYAQAFSENGVKLWRSPSFIGLDAPMSSLTPAGEQNFETVQLGDDSYFSLSYGVEWEDEAENLYPITFVVIEDRQRFDGQVQTFRGSLITWLSMAALVLLIIQLLIVRWGLRPLTQIADQVSKVERGEQESIGGDYPQELKPLARNLNEFIQKEHSHLARYRNTLGDLAHSLKTPLAVMRGESEKRDSVDIEVMQEQISRMTDIVDHQLRRASLSGGSVMLAPVRVKHILDKIVASLGKVYADKPVEVRINVEEDLLFFGVQDDLYEILGNCLDNAYKWCKQNIKVTARPVSGASVTRNGLALVIEDDGPGLDPKLHNNVVTRGAHSESEQGEYGIGLATVNDIVESYNGGLNLEASKLGGLKINIDIPAS